MLERAFTYEGFDGKTYTDTWGFYLSKADLLEIQLGSFVGLDALMRQLIDAKDGKSIMAIVKEIILKSVGKPSADGRHFIRNEEVRQDFQQTEAYSQLFEELVTDAEKAAEFIAAVVPKELGVRLREERAKKSAEGEE